MAEKPCGNYIFQMLKGSYLHSKWWNQIEIQAHPSFSAYPGYLQEWRMSNK